MSPVEHTPASAGRITSTCLGDVEPLATSWLWPGRIPAGALTLIEGDPGCGKSTIMASMAASITSGSPWPDGSPCEAGDVLILSSEEEVAATIRPKIDVAGGDARRVQILDGVRDRLGATPEGDTTRWFSLASDTAALEAKIREHDARVVFLDVLSSYLGDTDTHRDASVRTVLGPLARVASDTGAAIIGLRHLNKGTGTRALYRGGGSIAIAGQARAVFLAARPDPAEPRHLFACVKLNVAIRPRAIAYTLRSHTFTDAAGKPGEVARVEWGAEEDIDADHALASSEESPEVRDIRDEAREFLRHELADGPRPTTEVEAEAGAQDISTRTLKRARRDLGVKAHKDGDRGAWRLHLPAAVRQGGQEGHPDHRQHAGTLTPQNGSLGPSGSSDHAPLREEGQTTVPGPVPAAMALFALSPNGAPGAADAALALARLRRDSEDGPDPEGS